MDQDEIALSQTSSHERLSAEMPSLLAYHRTSIRLYMILERILAKINIPSCSASSAINTIARDSGTRRYRELSPHASSCDADHRPVGFDAELQREFAEVADRQGPRAAKLICHQSWTSTNIPTFHCRQGRSKRIRCTLPIWRGSGPCPRSVACLLRLISLAWLVSLFRSLLIDQ